METKWLAKTGPCPLFENGAESLIQQEQFLWSQEGYCRSVMSVCSRLCSVYRYEKLTTSLTRLLRPFAFLPPSVVIIANYDSLLRNSQQLSTYSVPCHSKCEMSFMDENSPRYPERNSLQARRIMMPSYYFKEEAGTTATMRKE